MLRYFLSDKINDALQSLTVYENKFSRKKHQYSLSSLKGKWQTADVRNSRSRFFRPLSTVGLLYDDL